MDSNELLTLLLIVFLSELEWFLHSNCIYLFKFHKNYLANAAHKKKPPHRTMQRMQKVIHLHGLLKTNNQKTHSCLLSIHTSGVTSTFQ